MDNYSKILFKHNAFEEEGIESAWAVKIGNNYQLDNILFYAQEYSLNDIIAVDDIDGELYVSALVEESGHSTTRILFDDTAIVESTRDILKGKGCSSELSNYEKLIAVDIPPLVSYKELKKYLEQGEKEGKWEYQEACISTRHGKEG